MRDKGKRFNIRYRTVSGFRYYLTDWVPDLETAVSFYESFKRRYLHPSTGLPRPYPNGKGVYDVQEPCIVARGYGTRRNTSHTDQRRA